MKPDWIELLQREKTKAYFNKLENFIKNEYQNNVVYPAKSEIYNAFALTGYQETNVVILGQDPYHGPYQAHGLSFSVVAPEAKFPPSLLNMFKELENDLNIKRTNLNLTDWAKQGVLMLNTVLTVQAGNAGSHRKQGWEQFTDTIIQLLNQKEEQVIFLLWGAHAKKKASLITNPSHKIITGVHPSPLSAHAGFFGSKPYSQINTYLEKARKKIIKW